MKMANILQHEEAITIFLQKMKNGKHHIQNAQIFYKMLGNRGIPYIITIKKFTKTCLELRLSSCKSLEFKCLFLLS